MSIAKRVALGTVFLWFFVGGTAHFVWTDALIKIVPPYVPWPRAAVLISGAFELLGAVGVIHPSTRRVAGIGLFALTVVVTPANVYMLEKHDVFQIPVWLLFARLPLQVLLLEVILWSTSRGKSGASA